MKQQRYPKTKIKPNAVLYSVFHYTDEDEHKTHADVEEWVVTSIKRPAGSLTHRGVETNASKLGIESAQVVHIAMKVPGLNWGKLQDGKEGFTTTNIYGVHKRRFSVGSDLPAGVYTTPLAALKYALVEVNKEIKDAMECLKESVGDEKEYNDWQQEILCLKKQAALIKSKITRIYNKAK